MRSDQHHCGGIAILFYTLYLQDATQSVAVQGLAPQFQGYSKRTLKKHLGWSPVDKFYRRNSTGAKLYKVTENQISNAKYLLIQYLPNWSASASCSRFSDLWPDRSSLSCLIGIAAVNGCSFLHVLGSGRDSERRGTGISTPASRLLKENLEEAPRMESSGQILPKELSQATRVVGSVALW